MTNLVMSENIDKKKVMEEVYSLIGLSILPTPYSNCFIRAAVSPVSLCQCVYPHQQPHQHSHPQ